MDLELPFQQRARLEEFQRKHRTGLVTLVFTDLVDSVALRRQLGDQAGVSLLQTHRQLIRQTLETKQSNWLAAKERSAAEPQPTNHGSHGLHGWGEKRKLFLSVSLRVIRKIFSKLFDADGQQYKLFRGLHREKGASQPR